MDSEKYKIHPADLEGKGVSVQSNPMELPVDKAKAVFDQLTKEVVVPKFNTLADAFAPVDLTPDRDKPISEATQKALDTKVNREKRSGSTTAEKVLSDNNFDDTTKEAVRENTKQRHSHENKAVLDTLTQTDVSNIRKNTDTRHSHENKAVLDTLTETDVSNIRKNTDKRHSHENKAVLDTLTQTDVSNIRENTDRRHSHSNKATLDRVASTHLNQIADNTALRHSHANQAFLDTLSEDTLAQMGGSKHENDAVLDQISAQTLTDIAENKKQRHSHENKVLLDSLTGASLQDIVDCLQQIASGQRLSNTDVLKNITAQTLADITKNSAQRHSHENKAVLDQIQDRDLDSLHSMESMKHSHSNQAVLDGFTQDWLNHVLRKDNAEPYTPTADTHPATKAYVDQALRDYAQREGDTAEKIDAHNQNKTAHPAIWEAMQQSRKTAESILLQLSLQTKKIYLCPKQEKQPEYNGSPIQGTRSIAFLSPALFDLQAAQSQLQAINAGGPYFIWVKPKAGYSWAIQGDTAPQGEEAISIDWGIAPKKLPVPQEKAEQLRYTGLEQAANIEVSSSFITQTDKDSKQTKAGRYPAVFALSDKGNFCWEDGSIEDKTVYWHILPKPVQLPVQEGELCYNGSVQQVKWQEENTGLEFLEATSGKEAGRYTVDCQPLENYGWADNAGSEKRQAVFCILPQRLPFPTAEKALLEQYERDGKYQKQRVTWKDYDPDKMSISGTEWAERAGSYCVTFVPKANYCWEDGNSYPKTVHWSILPVSGDMQRAVYDTRGKQEDIFQYVDTTKAALSQEIATEKADLHQTITAEAVKAQQRVQQAAAEAANSYSDSKLGEANTYTDRQIGQARKEIRQSTESYTNSKLTEAKQYTDSRETAVKKDLQGEIAKSIQDILPDVNKEQIIQSAVQTAQKYSDTKLTEAKSYSDTKLTEAKGYSDTKLSEAKGYSNTKLSEARSYTDSKAGENKQLLTQHSASRANPHSVTASQVGAYSKAEVDNKLKTAGGGKRSVRRVVGTRTAGWTEKDCDYLCDGTADDVEIMKAIQDIPASGGEVRILDGIYQITQSIQLSKSYVTLSGNGSGTELKRYFNSSQEEGVLTVTGTDNTIQNFMVNGQKAAYNSNNNMGIYLSQTRNNTVTGNACHDNYRGIALSASSNNTVTGNTCYDNGSKGIYLTNSSNNTVIGNNLRKNTDTGIALFNSSQVTASNNTVTGNICSDNNTSISLDHCSNNTVTGNTCSSNNNASILLEYSNNNTVTGNTCSSNLDDGIYLRLSNNNTITGNRAFSSKEGNTITGINIDRSNENIILGNQYHGYAAPQISGSGNIAEHNIG